MNTLLNGFCDELVKVAGAGSVARKYLPEMAGHGTMGGILGAVLGGASGYASPPDKDGKRKTLDYALKGLGIGAGLGGLSGLALAKNPHGRFAKAYDALMKTLTSTTPIVV